MDESKYMFILAVLIISAIIFSVSSGSNRPKKIHLMPFGKVKKDLMELAVKEKGYSRIFVIANNEKRYKVIHIEYKNGKRVQYNLKKHGVRAFSENEIKKLFHIMARELKGKDSVSLEDSDGENKKKEFMIVLAAKEQKKKKKK